LKHGTRATLLKLLHDSGKPHKLKLKTFESLKTQKEKDKFIQNEQRENRRRKRSDERKEKECKMVQETE